MNTEEKKPIHAAPAQIRSLTFSDLPPRSQSILVRCQKRFYRTHGRPWDKNRDSSRSMFKDRGYLKRNLLTRYDGQGYSVAMSNSTVAE